MNGDKSSFSLCSKKKKDFTVKTNRKERVETQNAADVRDVFNPFL
jgi:hypothetical protein